MDTVFETLRLKVRKAVPADAEFFYELWTNPAVMANVGFPMGLRITPQETLERIQHQPDSEFDCKLVVTLKTTGEAIGECKLGLPDAEGISETDVKLLPERWGQGYGVEIKRGLLRYLFCHSDCRAVKATPNINNLASIRMQEAVGGKRAGEGIFVFPPEMQAYTKPVHYYEYYVLREDWLKNHTLTVSKTVRLRPVSPQDFPTALEWYQQGDVLRYMDSPLSVKLTNLDGVRQLYSELIKLGDCFMIEVRSGAKWLTIGDITLMEANIPITIGRKEYWGLGIGRQVLQRIMRWARELGYLRLRSRESLSYNQRSILLFRSVGFKEIEHSKSGVLMEFVFEVGS